MFRKWLLPYAVMGAVLILAVCSLAYRTVMTERQQTLVQSAEQAERMAAFFEQNVLEILRYSDTYLMIARREYLEHGGVAAVRRMMHDFPLNNAIVSHITIIDETGTPVLISGHEIKAGTTARDRAYFKFHKADDGDQVYISLPRKGRNTGKITVRLVRRISKPGGGFGGVIFAAIDAASITKFSAAMRLGPNSSATLVGADKRIRARSSYGRVGPGQDISGSRIWRELARRPVGLYKQRSVVDDITRYYAYRRLAEFPLIVAIGVATEDIAAAVSAFETPTYLIAALISLLIAIMTAAVCREIHRARVDIEKRQETEEELRESEKRFRHAFENAPISMALVTPEGKLIKVNQALADLLGYSVEGLTDTTLSQCSGDEGKLDEAMRLRQRVLDGEADTYRNERSYQHKLGPIVEGEVHGSLYRNEYGEAEYFIDHTIDITEAKARESALRQSEANLRQILEESPLGVSVSQHERKDGEVVATRLFANDALAQMAGLASADELLQVNILESWLEPGQFQEVKEIFVDGGQLVDFEAVRRRADGSMWWVLMNSRPLVFDGRACTMIWHLDITGRKQVEMALQESERQLRTITNALPVLIAHLDAEQRYLYINKTGEDWFGKTVAEIIGQEFAAVAGEEQLNAFQPSINRALKGERVTFEAVSTYPDGQTRNIQVTYIPDIGEGGGMYADFSLWPLI